MRSLTIILLTAFISQQAKALEFSQLEYSIDQNIENAKTLEQEANDIFIDDSHLESPILDQQDFVFNKAQMRKQKKWQKLLTKKTPKILHSIDRDVDGMSDIDVELKLSQININQNAEVSSREQLKEYLHQSVPKITNLMANHIAKAGGIVPFMLHLKKELRDIRETKVTTHSSKQADRSPAQMETKDKVNPLIFLGIIVILASLIHPVSTVGIVIGGGMLVTALIIYLNDPYPIFD